MHFIFSLFLFLGIEVGPSRIRSAGRGVWATKDIQPGTVYGPYEGTKEGRGVKGKKDVKQVKEAGYSWEVNIIECQ